MLAAVKIILVIVLVILAVVAIGALWLIRKFKSVVNELKSVVKETMGAESSHPPCRIHPQPEPNPQWRNPEEIRQYSEQFVAQGFTSLGAFTIPETGGLQLAAFAHEAERFYGVAYDHAKLPPNIDIVADMEDGTELCASNTKFGDTVERRPEVISIRLDGGGAKELLEAVRAQPIKSPRKPVKGEDFATQFRASYARTMNWRMKKGGVSREEIRRQAEKDGTALDADGLEEVYKAMRAAYVTQLQAACIAQYLDEQKPTPVEWEALQPQVFAVPETLTEEEVCEVLELRNELDEEQAHRLKQIKLTFGQTALDFMRQVVDENIGALGLKRLGAVHEPVSAELFLARETSEPETSDAAE